MPILASLVEVVSPLSFNREKTQKHGTTAEGTSFPQFQGIKFQVGYQCWDRCGGQKGELDGGNSHICYFHPKPWGK